MPAFNINTAIRSALLAKEGLAPLISDNVEDPLAARIFSLRAPLGTSGVWIAFMRVSGNKESDMTGDAGLDHPRYQFTIGGEDKDAVDAVRGILLAFNGTEYVYNNGTIEEPALHTLTFFHVDDRDGYTDETSIVHPTVDLAIWYNTQPQ